MSPNVQQSQDLRDALAVALGERKQQTKASEIGWKRKAMAARGTLLKLSKSLKQAESQNGSDAISAMLHVLESTEVEEASTHDTRQPAASLHNQANDLKSFIDAVEVQLMS